MSNGTNTPNGKQRIVQRARALFLERGYAAVSMQDIADAAELRKASIYHHFRHKSALFQDVMVSELASVREEVARLSSEDGDLRDQLLKIATAYFGRIQDDLMRMIQDFRIHVPEAEHDEIHAELKRLADAMATVFERAVSAGVPIAIKPKLAGWLYFQMIAAWAFHAFDDPAFSLKDPKRAAEIVTGIMLDGILHGTRPATA